LTQARGLATFNFNLEEEDDEESDEDAYDEDEEDEYDTSYEAIQRLMHATASMPTCHSIKFAPAHTSVKPQGVRVCFQDHGIECAMEVDNRQTTALHILCANPHVTTDCIRAYLQLAPEAAEQEDSYGMTPFQYLLTSDISFLEDRNFSSLMAWWYGSTPPHQTKTGKKRKCE